MNMPARRALPNQYLIREFDYGEGPLGCLRTKRRNATRNSSVVFFTLVRSVALNALSWLLRSISLPDCIAIFSKRVQASREAGIIYVNGFASFNKGSKLNFAVAYGHPTVGT